MIPEGVDKIGTNAFSCCTSLNRVVLPESLFEMNAYVFDECNGLERLILPKRLCAISDFAFDDCENLTLEVFPGSHGEAYAKENGIPYRLLVDKSGN